MELEKTAHRSESADFRMSAIMGVVMSGIAFFATTYAYSIDRSLLGNVVFDAWQSVVIFPLGLALYLPQLLGAESVYVFLGFGALISSPFFSLLFWTLVFFVSARIIGRVFKTNNKRTVFLPAYLVIALLIAGIAVQFFI